MTRTVMAKRGVGDRTTPMQYDPSLVQSILKKSKAARIVLQEDKKEKAQAKLDKDKKIKELVDFEAYKKLKNSGIQMTPTPNPVSESNSEAGKSAASETFTLEDKSYPAWFSKYFK